METAATIASYASGFFLLRYRLGAADLLMTSLAINAALGPLTALIAARRGRHIPLWIALGFGLGMWALAAVLLSGAPRSKPDAPTAPDFPTSHAA
jgi:type IV secretory pathway TrbD component